MLDSMTIDHKVGKGITRIPVADKNVGTRWVECGWCRQEVTGEVAKGKPALCGKHLRIFRETF